MSTLLRGAPVAERLTLDLSRRSAALRQRGVTPTLAIIRVGRDPGGLAYEKGAASRCAKCGSDLRRSPLDDAASLPEVIVCDEPISALDVSIQAQIVNLLIDLQKRMGLTYLFVAHDLSMVKHISDRVAVLYLGTLVELTTSEELYANPQHPYTRALLSAIPIPDPKIEQERDAKKIRLEGEVPSPINSPAGCKFQGRCKCAMPICRQEMPKLRDIGGGHFVACHICDPSNGCETGKCV